MPTSSSTGVEPGDQRGAGPVPDRSCRSPSRWASVVGVAALHNVMMVENLSMYRRLGFVETRLYLKKGVNRIYMRRSLAKGEE